MAELGEVNKNKQILLDKTTGHGNLKNAHLWIVQCARTNNSKRCGHVYGVNGEDFWQRKCPRCSGGAKGLLIPNNVRSRIDLWKIIQQLSPKAPLVTRSSKGVWLGWLSNYRNRAYGRANTNRDAEFIYNALNSAAMIVWLASASGVGESLVRKALSSINLNHTRMTQAATVRQILPWQLIAARLSTLVPHGYEEVVADDELNDLEEIHRSDEKETTKRALMQARLGQGQFRADLERRWNGSCAVTGCDISAVLRASHIKPWSTSSNRERLNPANGILLAAHIDALFDCGLISFADNGIMLVSKQIADELEQFNLPDRLRRQPTKDERRFLAFHRRYRFTQ